MLSREKLLIDYINERLSEREYTDINVTNVRVFADGNLFADVSYTWKLNAWEHRAEHKDVIFVYKDKEWHSPLFF
jgi:hypothetical protein